MAQEVVDSKKIKTLLDEANEYTRNISPWQVNKGMTQQSETQEQQHPEDQNFMKSVQMLPKDEQDAALAQYLSSGGPEAYRDYMSQRRYLEDPQLAAKREQKERRNQRLISAMNMIGAMGNFVQAGAQTDGRSVPVANTTESYDKKLEAERKMRSENLAQANALGSQYRQMAGGIIKQGYQNVEDRKKLDQQERIAQAKLDLQAQEYANRAMNNQRNYDLKKQDFEIKKQLADKRASLLDAQRVRALNLASGNSGGKVSSSSHVCLSDGVNNYLIPKENWQSENISKAWSLLPKELQDEALEQIIHEIANTTEEQQQALNLFRQDRSKILQLNANTLRNAIGVVMGRPGSEAMMKYIGTLVGGAGSSGGSTATGGGYRRNGTRGSRGGGSGGGAATNSEDDV